MFEFRIGDVLDLDDGAYHVEGLQGGCLRLLRQHDQQVQIMHVTALSRRLALPPRMNHEISAPDALSRLTSEERQRVRELSRHIEEEIGRASCRERVWVAEVGGWGEENG